MTKICVIIDAYSTGKWYTHLFQEQGYKCLHILSNNDLPDFCKLDIDQKQYFGNYVWEDLDKTVAWIQSFGTPEFVIAGCETGVIPADILAHYFQLSTSNGILKSEAKRDKFLMGEALREAGIRSIPQLKVNQFEQVLPWMHSSAIEFPIVIKPMKSAGGEGFFLCPSVEKLFDAFRINLNQKDMFNQTKEALLVQKQICGAEYVVNTVSCRGLHVISEFCYQNKVITPDGSSVYKSTDFISRDFEHSKILEAYVFRVLDALEIRFGAAHAEIMIDQDGPVLIEIGLRPMGSSLFLDIVTESYGHNQVMLNTLAHTDPEKFLTVCGGLSSLRKHLSLVYISSCKNGLLTKFSKDKIENLKSFKKMVMYNSIGTEVRNVRNMDDLIGMVYLMHENKEVLKNDKSRLEEMSSNGILFEVS